MHYLGKLCNILLVFFLQAVQKQIVGAVENWTAIWSPVVSEIQVSEIIKIW